MKFSILLSLILLYLSSSISSATPMSDGDAQAFIVSSRQTCFKNTRSSTTYKSLSDGQISQYCSCYSNKAASIITDEDLKIFSKTKDASIFDKMRIVSTEYCDAIAIKEWKWDFKRILNDVPNDSLSNPAFKTAFIRGFLKSCNRGGLSTGAHDVIVDKLLSRSMQDAMCKCEANKSVDILPLEKIREAVESNDLSPMKSELGRAVNYCMDESKILSANTKLALAFSFGCKRDYTASPGGYSTYEIDSICVCKGKRVANKFGSLEKAAALSADSRKAITDEASDYCERYAF